MVRLAFNSRLGPDELKELAQIQVAMAMRIEPGPDRLRVQTIADALVNLAEIKGLLSKYERRSLN